MLTNRSNRDRQTAARFFLPVSSTVRLQCMNRVTTKVIVFVIFTVVACVSCTDQGSYDAKLNLEEAKNAEEFIVKLKNSNLDYRIDKNGYLYFHSRDKDYILKAALTNGNPSYPVPDTAKSWNISQEDAKNIILETYPNILTNAHMVGPVTSKVQNKIDGFVLANEDVWHVRIHCNKGGVYALFLVHPESGEVFVIQEPNENRESSCKR